MISIVTPTYNRALLLSRLYESLKAQSCHDFEWIIVDDGSTDNTTETVKRFIDENSIPVTLLYQPNGGKHTATNLALPYCSKEWTCIVDSDDWLTPNAVEILSKQARQIDTKTICGISALKATSENKTIGKHPEIKVVDLPFFDYYFKLNFRGDRLLMFRTELMKQHPFPVFENEKFIPEGVVWQSITKGKLVRFINSKLNICEYQPNGLTAQYRALMENNPVGNALYYKILSENERATFITRIKSSVLHLYLLEIATKNSSDVSSVLPDKKLRLYHIFARILMPIYKLKRILGT
ncbi:MAG: glycosyltransferase family 2 protein [Muribaculaceae bacterium]|nr:glycosyltransferase family 2 protein [Muribaculaceae bacterium]MDE6644106.1 glycosyltransferase family 2 protein [Muribaculaceae bacterium]